MTTPQLSPPPAPQVEAVPEIDRHDPLVRFELLTASTYGGVEKAYIKDLLVGESRLIAVGETIGNCKLMGISLKTQSVRLKPPEGAEFTVRRNPPAKRSTSGGAASPGGASTGPKP